MTQSQRAVRLHAWKCRAISGWTRYASIRRRFWLDKVCIDQRNTLWLDKVCIDQRTLSGLTKFASTRLNESRLLQPLSVYVVKRVGQSSYRTHLRSHGMQAVTHVAQCLGQRSADPAISSLSSPWPRVLRGFQQCRRDVQF